MPYYGRKLIMKYNKLSNLFDKKHIKDALELVFNEYLNDNYTYSLFREFPLKKIEEDLHQTFLSLINENKNEAKRILFKLGRYFYEKNLPFSFFYDTCAKMKLFILKSGKLPCSENADEIEEIFEFVENIFSYGYLNNLVIEDKNWVRDELRVIKNSESLLKVYIRDHLVWINKLIEDIRKLRFKSSVELNPTRCEFGKKLISGIFDPILSSKYKDIITSIHTKIHRSASEIYFFMEKRRFKNLLIEYINMIKNVGRLISTIGLNFAVVSESEAKIDPLTGVFNRRSMEIMLINQLSIAKLTNTPFSLAMLDIDDFKKVNDTYGHLVGDYVLRNLAIIIRENLRKSDFIFRYGGEEFLILLPFTDIDSAKYVMEKIRKKIEENIFKCEGLKLKITVSIGISQFTEKTLSIDTLIDEADKNLYIAKKTGKNKVIV